MAEPQIKSFEEIISPVKPFEEIPGQIMRIGPAPEPSFGQKWKEYFFPTTGRWTKPDRYEKFYNATKWPGKTALNCIGSKNNRGNKVLTKISVIPEIIKTKATLNPSALKDIFP